MSGHYRVGASQAVKRDPLAVGAAVGHAAAMAPRLLACAALLLACRAPTPAAAPAPAVASAPAPASNRPAVEMRTYYLVLLRRGPAWSAARTPEVERIGAGHMAHIREMAAAGQLILAGPFDADATDRAALAGLYLFDVPTLAQVKQLVEADPGVQAGRFSYQILTWYGPKGVTYQGR